MTKKCIYCNSDIPSESVIDFCSICGKGVWGEKMFNAIVQNMENARERGDLTHMNSPLDTLRNVSDLENKGFF